MSSPARLPSERPARVPARIEERLARGGGAIELLRAPAALFGLASRLRARLYDRGWLPAYRVGVPVVSVGNLTAGGTGKTPMVAWLVERLAGLGLAPGVLSRGYRAVAGEANDEGQLLARLLPGVPHVQDPDRVAGAAELERAGVDVIVLDDGFQHRRLVRDLDLVLVDATCPFGPGAARRALLPRGLLREPPGALARADALIVMRCDLVPAEELAALERELAALAPRRPIARARHAPLRLWRAGEPSDAGALRGLAVDLVSGIGNPAAFEATVRALGAQVVEHRAFPDHHAYRPGDLEGLGARPIVTTAKDGVKLARERRAPWVLDVAIAIEHGEETLAALLAALPEGAGRRERRALHEGLHG